MPLDPGYHVEWTGIAREQRANEGRLGKLLILSCLFAYLFLVAQYESWTLPVSILLAVLALGHLQAHKRFGAPTCAERPEMVE